MSEDWGDWGSQETTVNSSVSKPVDDWGEWGNGSNVTSSEPAFTRTRVGRGRAVVRNQTAQDYGPGFSDMQSEDWGSQPDSAKESRLNGNCLTIYISSSETGRVIGRGGATIQEIQSLSGAHVKIHRDPVGSQTQVDITGTADQRGKAQALIEEKTGTPPAKVQKVEVADAYEPIDWGAAIKASEEATKAKWASLPPVQKNFYFEDPAVRDMSQKEADKIRTENNNISITHFDENDTRKLPNPTPTFYHAFAKYPEILAEIEKNGFKQPSPIQCQAWPVLLSGIDMIGVAQTGTGKTLAFLLPAMIHIEGQTTPRSQRLGPTALIIAPTRELAQQIEREAKKYSYKGIRTICIYGGGDRQQQCAAVARGVEIVIATPGRLNDLCMARVIDLTAVSYLVLDEADRMLDMGFEPQIRKIMLDIRPDRQTVMTSATWPPSVRKLAINYMSSPFQVYVNTLNLATVHSVKQIVHIIESEKKRAFLEDFLQNIILKNEETKAIVFVMRKVLADEISSDLALKGYVSQCIHGDRDQADREQALEDLKTNTVRVLIATDVASRGIDIEDITHILNFDFPKNMEEYVHRVGRTGRADRKGTAISLVTREDWRHAEQLIGILEEAEQEVPDDLRNMALRYKEYLQRKAHEEEVYGKGGRGGDRGGGGGRRGGGFGGGGRRDDYNDFSFSGSGSGGRRSGPRW